MKKSIFSIPICLIYSFLTAQPSIEWQKTFGGSDTDQARSIQQTIDGGFVVAGQSVSSDGDVFGNHGGIDFWVLKLDITGMIQWKKTYGGSDNDRPYSIRQTNDKGFVVVGHTLSNDGDVKGNHGDYDAWVLKLDSMGAIEWQKCLGGSGWDEAWSVKQTTNGGYIIAGRSNSTDGDLTINHGSQDFWVVKLTNTGEIEWQKSLGGSGLDIGYAVSNTNDGGYVVAGESSSIDGDVTGNHGSSDYWVVKLNYEGKIEWEKSLGGTSIDDARDIHQTRDGGYVVLGQSYSNDGDVTGHHGGYDFWVVKLSKMGEIEWQKALGGSNEDNASEIYQSNDDGYVMTGTTQSTNGDVLGNDGGTDVWVVKLSSDGEFKWQKTLGGSQPEVGHSIEQTNEGGYIVAGFAWSDDGDVSGVQGKSDFWIVKLSPESSSTTSLLSFPLEIYPNPASQSISLKIPTEEHSITVSISDILGRIVSHQTISNANLGSEKIDVAALANGFFFLTATTPSGQVFVGKIRKE